MVDVAALTALIEPEVEALGYHLVRVAMIGGTSDPTLQVMAERSDTRQLRLEDCEQISRRLSEIFDEKDPIDGGYRLQVSSPGIDRPLTRLKDFADWAGHQARLTLAEPSESRKQISGTLLGIQGNIVQLTGKDGQPYSIAFPQITSAKLLLTDALIKATAPLDADGADLIKMEG